MKSLLPTPLPSLVVFALVFLLVGNLEDAVGQFHVGQCPRGGRQCNGCQLVEDCTEQGGLFTIQSSPVDTCNGDEACDASKDVARCEPGAICRYKQFECPPDLEGEAVFPDPYSCVEYHVCKDGQPKDYTCGPNQIFDLRQKRCVHGEGGCSTTPFPLCEEAGTVWSIAGTDYEYVCVEKSGSYRAIYPQVRLKVQRQVRDDDNDDDKTTSTTSGTSTTDKSKSTTTSPEATPTTSAGSTTKSEGTTTTSAGSTSKSEGTTTTSEGSTSKSEGTTTTSAGSSSTEPASTKTSPETEKTPTTEVEMTTTAATTEMPSPCTNGAGVYEVPEDCRKYYVCYLLPNGDLAYQVKICRPGSHFDDGAKRCVAGSCTHFPSTSSPGTVPTTMTAVDCESDGLIADKECCKCYYACYNTGGGLNYVRKCCRSGSHFDAGKNRCVAGDKCSPMDKCP